MEQETPRSVLSEEILLKIAEYRQEKRERKEEFLNYHRERRPVYPSTSEEGAFVGLFGYATTIGVRIFSYYRTESGIYFYEFEENEENPKREKEIMFLDIEKVQQKGIAKLYTSESFLDDKSASKSD